MRNGKCYCGVGSEKKCSDRIETDKSMTAIIIIIELVMRNNNLHNGRNTRMVK